MQGGPGDHAGRPFFPSDICAELEALPRPGGLVTTPVHLRVLLAEASELPAVDFLLCATAPLSPQLAIEARDALRSAASRDLRLHRGRSDRRPAPNQTQEWRTLPG